MTNDDYSQRYLLQQFYRVFSQRLLHRGWPRGSCGAEIQFKFSGAGVEMMSDVENSPSISDNAVYKVG